MGVREYIRKRRLERRKKRRKRTGRTVSVQPGKWEALWLRYAVRIFLLGGMMILYFLLRPGRDIIGQLEVGERSPETILAPFDFEYVDEEATEAARRRAEAEVQPVFFERHNLIDDRIELWEQLIARASELRADETLDAGTRVSVLQSEFPEVDFIPTTWLEILKRSSNAQLATLVPEALRAVWKRLVPTEVELEIIRNSPRGFDVLVAGDQGVDHLTPEGVATLAQARAEVVDYIRGRVPGEIESVAAEAAQNLLLPNLRYDPLTTEKRRWEAQNEVQPLLVPVPKGREIVHSGERVDPQAYAMIREICRRQAAGAFLPHVGAALLSSVSLLFLARYFRRFHPEYFESPGFFGLLVVLVVGLLMTAKALQLLDSRLLERWGNVGLLLPVAGLGMVVSALMGSRAAVVPIGIASVLAAQILGGKVELGVIFFISGIVGAYRVVSIRKRTDMYEAGLWASAVAVVVYLAFVGVRYPVFSLSPTYQQQVLFGILWAGLSGVFSFILALSFLPLLEDVLGVTTDLKLLEYTAKSDLLRDLERSAPGTYQHSLHVSNLSESAADAIGANSLLCRVGSLYHDIGKIRKPQYFSENQVSALDKRIHSKISPNLSCLLIRNHVKDGLEMADEAGLPEPIRDSIAQHHGTTLISFFYDKALSENPGGKLKESDFRYGGPRPQTIETAIIMLADSIEAASRSLPSYSHGEIQLLVRKVINDKFMDGQFEECDLTLKELHVLSDSFANSLASLLHRRISYPSTTPPEREAREGRQRAEADKESSRTPAPAADG